MATTETPLLDLDALEQRWGNPDKGILSTLWTEEMLAAQSTLDVPVLIEECRRLRAELEQASSGDDALRQENEALRQANADAREAIKELRARVEQVNPPETPE